MAITFDPAKNERNLRLRGLPLAMAGQMVWSEAKFDVAKKQEPTGSRFVATGEIDGILYVVVFLIEGSDTRIISLRRAKAKERKAWHAARTPT